VSSPFTEIQPIISAIDPNDRPALK